MAVHHCGQVAPSACDLQVRHVRDPHLVAAIDGQRMNLVVHAGEEPAQAWQASIQRSRARAHCVLAHQALDPAAPNRLALSAQLGVHTRTAVGFPALPMHLANPRHQASVLLRTLTERTGTPGIETTGADTEQAAQPPHRIALLLGLDESEAFAFRSEVNAIAFFKRSCSTFSCS